MSEERKTMTTDDGRPVGDNQNSLPDARKRLIGNIVASMKSVPRRIQELQVQHFYKADPDYGSGVARGLGLNWNESSYADSKPAAANK
jgi:catalase